MLTCRQVGQAIAGAAVREKAGFEAIPVAMYNMKWDKFLKIVYEARGMGPDRKIVGVQEDDIEAAITDSIRVSQASYDGKVKLLEMKGE